MTSLQERSKELAERLGLTYEPVGVFFTPSKPENSVSFKTKGKGCVAPLIFLASKGKTVAFDADSTGFSCSAFYLGYADWIFPGIENFLSDGPLPGRECERFVQTPDLAKTYLTTLRAPELRRGAIVFKPISQFQPHEEPKIVLLFADPDQMSALVFLAHFKNPTSTDRVMTGFASACASFFTLPLREAEADRRRAVWGLHDIAARAAFPKELTSLAMPTALYEEFCAISALSFLETENWKALRVRGRQA